MVAASAVEVEDGEGAVVVDLVAEEDDPPKTILTSLNCCYGLPVLKLPVNLL